MPEPTRPVACLTGKFREETVRASGIPPDRVLPSVAALTPA